MKKRCARQRISATIGKTPSGAERTGLLQNGSTKKNSSTQALKDSRMVRCEIRREIFVSSSASRVLEFLSPRVQRPPDSADNLTVTKTTFDDLVSVVDVSNRV